MIREGLIDGIPVLQHFQVGTRTLLENSRAVLDGSDYSQIVNHCHGDGGGFVSRMILVQMKRAVIGKSETEFDTQLSPTRLGVNYCSFQLEIDLFPDPCLLDLIDSDEHE